LLFFFSCAKIVTHNNKLEVKPKMKRKISLLLALCLIFGCLGILSSCNQEEGPDETEIGVLDVAWAKDLDFGGVTLTVSQSINVWDPATSIDNAQKFTMATKANNADTVLNACFERNEAVKKTINVKVHYEPTDLRFDGIATYMMDIITQSIPIDLIINDVYGVVAATTNGYLFNLKTQKIAGKDINNYFNLDHASWYDDYMAGLTVDQDKMYGLAGHYFMDIIRSAHCLYLNTEIFEDKFAADYDDIDIFYNQVKDGEFTYDLFGELIQRAFEDRSNQGVTDKDDQLGLLMHSTTGLCPFVYSSEISVLDYSGKSVTVKPNIAAEVEAVATAINSIMHQEGTYFYSSHNENNLPLDTFTEGGTLFVNTLWLGHLEQSALQGMENKAAIVYPKINEDYNYSSYVHDSAEIGYIPTTCQNFEAVSAYVQLLNEQSTSIIDAYFENQLKYKYNTADSTAAIEMLDIINETIGSPAYQFIEGPELVKEASGATTLFQCISNAVNAGTPTNAATKYTASLTAYETGLNNLKQKFAVLP